MDSILDKQLVLQLNKNWQVIGVRSVRQAIVSLCSESEGQKPAFALDIEMAKDENGKDVLVYANPVEWDDWIKLPVRPQDLSVNTSRSEIRVPTVIVAANYSRIPLRRPRLSPTAIWERDQGTCQYTGKKLTRKQGNLDHVLPRDRGGKDTWENLVLSDKDVNSRKGNKLNSEAGLTLIRQPKAPPATPVSASIKEAKHLTWLPFLIHNQ